jgi:lipase ATG15
LGGALASLVALTHDLPGVAFEAPGDFQYAERIGLVPDLPDDTKKGGKDDGNGNPGDGDGDSDDGYPNYDLFLETLPIYHVGNTKDPIYMGACQGAGSSCWYVGYGKYIRSIFIYYAWIYL